MTIAAHTHAMIIAHVGIEYALLSGTVMVAIMLCIYRIENGASRSGKRAVGIILHAFTTILRPTLEAGMGIS